MRVRIPSYNIVCGTNHVRNLSRPSPSIFPPPHLVLCIVHGGRGGGGGGGGGKDYAYSQLGNV